MEGRNMLAIEVTLRHCVYWLMDISLFLSEATRPRVRLLPMHRRSNLSAAYGIREGGTAND